MDTTTEPADSAAAAPSGARGGSRRNSGRAARVAAAVAVLTGALAPAATQGTPSSADAVPVIVRELPGAGELPERAVAAFGGAVERQLGLIGGFSASLPATG